MQKAVSLIQVEFEPIPGIFGIDDTLRPDALLVHEQHPDGNILLKAEILMGEAEKAMMDCDEVIEETFEVPMFSHAFLEGKTALPGWNPTAGRFWSSRPRSPSATAGRSAIPLASPWTGYGSSRPASADYRRTVACNLILRLAESIMIPPRPLPPS